MPWQDPRKTGRSAGRYNLCNLTGNHARYDQRFPAQNGARRLSRHDARNDHRCLPRNEDRNDPRCVRLSAGHYKEEQLRAKFLNPFFTALGWDIDNKQGEKPEVRKAGDVRA